MTATTPNVLLDAETARAMTLAEADPITGLDGAAIGTRDRELWQSGDGAVTVGVWEVDAGAFASRFQHYGECVTLVRGELHCTPADGGPAFTVRAGETVVFPRGWTGAWRTPDGLRKIYTIWSAQ